MNELIERLRVYAGEGAQTDAARITQREAADAIEALQAENERLQKEVFGLTGEVANKADYAARMYSMHEAAKAERDALQSAIDALVAKLEVSNIAVDLLKADLKSAEVRLVTLTDEQILDLAKIECRIQFSSDDIQEDSGIESVIALARAVEAAHGIQAKGGQQ